MIRSVPIGVVVLALLAASCGGEEEITPSASVNPESTASLGPEIVGDPIPPESVADPEVVAVDATSCTSSVCLTVNSVTFHPFRPESEGRDGVLLDITIEYKSAPDELGYRVHEFLAVDDDGFVYQPHSSWDPSLLGGATVSPGLKAQRQIIFDMIEGAEVRELRWTASTDTVIVSMAPEQHEAVPAESVAYPRISPIDTTSCESSVCLTLNFVSFHPFGPEFEGQDGVLFDITIENRSTADELRYRVDEFLAVDSDGFVYQPFVTMGTPPLGLGTIPPGLKAQGQILFDVAEGAQVRELRWAGASGTIVVSVAPS